jgi:primosomal protein N' (replication factor Y)
MPAAARRAAWFAAAAGRGRIAIGTRSALLVPLPPPALLALLDEQDPAHKPPGAPRLHSRELLLHRAALDGSRLLLLSATPSAEIWWRAQNGQIARREPAAAPWPEMVAADTRGILRHHPLTPPLTRAIAEAIREGRRAAVIVPRAAAGLACDDCGSLLRCPDCGVPFARAPRALRCRLCGRADPLPERCAGCGGHRLSPFGWDAPRVQAALLRRFPRITVSRGDPRAQVMIGPPGLLRAAPRGGLGCVGIVALDGLLRAPDFRADEHAFGLLWAAAEACGADSRVIVQTLHPEHRSIRAAREQNLGGFYEHELKLRLDLGYPPFRRLCLVSARGRSRADARAPLDECAAGLGGIAGLTVYPPAPVGAAGAEARRWRFLIKGPEELPRLIGAALTPFLERRRRGGGVVEIEMDPLSW